MQEGLAARNVELLHPRIFEYLEAEPCLLLRQHVGRLRRVEAEAACFVALPAREIVDRDGEGNGGRAALGESP